MAKVGCRLPNNILGSSHLETELLKKAFLANLRADVTLLQLLPFPGLRVFVAQCSTKLAQNFLLHATYASSERMLIGLFH